MVTTKSNSSFIRLNFRLLPHSHHISASNFCR
nr:MAG TPA: hypothetical protein [Caudoviricetes sp.]